MVGARAVAAVLEEGLEFCAGFVADEHEAVVGVALGGDVDVGCVGGDVDSWRGEVDGGALFESGCDLANGR